MRCKTSSRGIHKSLGRTVRRISPEAQKLLQSYSWPGNVRELKNVIERAIILSNSDELLPAHFPQEIVGYGEGSGGGLQDAWEEWLSQRPFAPSSFEEISGKVERSLIRSALEEADHNRTRAAELLGFTKVDQPRYLMRKYNIE